MIDEKQIRDILHKEGIGPPDGHICEADCKCTTNTIVKVLAKELVDGTMLNDCGNPKHPDGSWHRAEPIPLSSQWLNRFRQWWRRQRYGCGCPQINVKRNQSKHHEEWGAWSVDAPDSGYPDRDQITALAKSFKSSHYVDIRIRHNGEYWHVNGDWIKYLDQLFWGCKECKGDCQGHDDDGESAPTLGLKESNV